MDWALLPLHQYANFSGRSRRLEYWMFVLLIVIGAILFSIIDAGWGLEWGARRAGGILTSFFLLAMVIPLAAASFRRLHDIGRSGWWIAVPAALYAAGTVATEVDAGMAALSFLAVGMIGSIVILIFCCLPGTPGRNVYGLNPKYSPDLEMAE